MEAMLIALNNSMANKNPGIREVALNHYSDIAFLPGLATDIWRDFVDQMRMRGLNDPNSDVRQAAQKLVK